MILLLIYNLAIFKITLLRKILEIIRPDSLNVTLFLTKETLMLIRDLFVKRKPRSFGFTPFYYKEKKSTELEEDGSRIQFRRIRTNITFGKRSTRSMIVLVLLSSAMLFYFMRLVDRDLSTSELEKIKIEVVPNED